MGFSPLSLLILLKDHSVLLRLAELQGGKTIGPQRVEPPCCRTEASCIGLDSG